MRVKICGMTDAENVSEVAGLKPSFLGFIFYDGSPRNASGKLLPEIIKNLAPEIIPVAVFVNEELSYVINIIEQYGFRYVQLHGTESVEYCNSLKVRGISIIKVFSINTSADFIPAKDYEKECDYFLFDTKSSKHGGTGTKFNWDLLYEYNCSRPVILSGGIGPDDAEIIRNLAVQYPFVKGIDLNSKFEIAPGLKDTGKLNTFLRQLHTPA